MLKVDNDALLRAADKLLGENNALGQKAPVGFSKDVLEVSDYLMVAQPLNACVVKARYPYFD
jgi:hypothetical protein